MPNQLPRHKDTAGRGISFFRNDILICLLLCAINIIWFSPLMRQGIIMGDDLAVIMTRDVDIWDAFVPKGTKYRPVYRLFAILSAHLFDDRYELYFWLNIVMNIVVSLALYNFVKRITADKRFVSFAVTALYICSPFIYYNIMQVLGFMEALCLLLLIVVFHYSLSYMQGKNNAVYYAVIAAVLLTFTHERYVVISPLLVIIVLCAEHEKISVRAWKALICLLPLGINFLLKKLVFQTDFMVGTSGTNVSINLTTIFNFFTSGLLAIFGIYDGVEYLVGTGFSKYPDTYRGLSVAVVVLSFVLLFVYIAQCVVFTKDKRGRIRELKFLLIAAAAIGVLLISGCVTVRIEQRWVAAPFVAYVAYLGYIISRIQFKFDRVLRNLVVVSLVAMAIFVNHLQHEGVWKIYFARAMHIAQNVYDASIGEYGETLADYTVYIMGNNELKWAVGTSNLSMFDVYLDRNVDFKYASSLEQVNQDYMKTDPAQRKEVKIFRMDGSLNVTEIPTATIGMYHESDFGEFENEISPDRPADTPSGEGVFFSSTTNFTVLSGYSIVFSDVIFPQDAIAYFECSMPYVSSDGAFVTIKLIADEETVELAAFPIYPSTTSKVDPLLIEIRNQDVFSGDISITVSSPSGDASADWVNFTNPGIYTVGE